VGGAYPPAAHRNRPVVDPADAQLLEALYAAYDVDQCVNRTDLMQGNLIGRYPMDAPLGFAEDLKRAHCTLAHPIRELGPLYDLDQLADVPMGPVVVGMIMLMLVEMILHRS
jgi:hypothetical protein